MLISEDNLERAIKKFFEIVKIKTPENWSLLQDRYLLKKSIPAFIAAIKEIEEIDFCYGFDESKIFEELNDYQLQLKKSHNKSLNLT